MNEYNVDGFRFDGITSMLYKHHGQFLFIFFLFLIKRINMISNDLNLID